MAFFGKYALAALGAAVAVSSAAHAQTADWTNRINVNGDFRFRLERDFAGGYTPVAGTNASNVGPSIGSADDYARIRARLGVTGKVNDSLLVVTRLSTGNNQYTTNATMGGSNFLQTGSFGSRKLFSLDLAYADYRIMDGMNVQVGKVPVLFWTPARMEMVWNLAATFEGAQYKWAGNYGDWKPWFVFNYSTPLNRVDGAPQTGPTDGSNGADVNLLAAQIGTMYKSDTMWTVVGLGSYNYNSINGLNTSAAGYDSAALTPSVSNIGNQFTMSGYNGVANGNRTNAAGTQYADDYQILDLGAEYGYYFGFAPVSVFGEYVTNTAVSQDGVATNAGIKVGALKDVGSWYAQFDYRDVRRSSLLGAYTDIGYMNGGVDVYGGQILLGWQWMQNTAIGFDWDFGHKIASQNGGVNYELYTADLVTTF